MLRGMEPPRPVGLDNLLPDTGGQLERGCNQNCVSATLVIGSGQRPMSTETCGEQ